MLISNLTSVIGTTTNLPKDIVEIITHYCSMLILVDESKTFFDNSAIFLARSFGLIWGAGDPRKVCYIPDQSDFDSKSDLTLHQRQSLAERLIAEHKTTGACNINKLTGFVEPGWTYLIANLGFVISDRVHKKGGFHQRVFKTIPICFYNRTIFGFANRHSHAERALYFQLSEREFFLSLLQKFKEYYGIKSDGHKIYAMILDMHATRDSCIDCVKNQAKERVEYIKKELPVWLKEEKFVIPQKRNISIVIRFSSNKLYDNNGGDQMQGLGAWLEERANSTTTYTSTAPFDIRHFSSQFAFLHGDNTWHGFWNEKKREQYRKKSIWLENWTAFSSTYGIYREDNPFDYTNLGVVDNDEEKSTTTPSSSSSSFSSSSSSTSSISNSNAPS